MSLLEGRTVLVTGGARGIGREHCLELARNGASVAILDPGVTLAGTADEENPAESVAAEVRALGARAMVIEGSVTDWKQVAGAVAAVVEELGSLDAVVNNAGIVRDQMITSANEDDFDAVIAVHLKGTFVVTKHACDHWRAEAKAGRPVSGRIINTTSGAGLFGNLGQAAYAAAKGAVTSLTLVTALEMRRYEVTANAISPVAMTRMTANVSSISSASVDPDAYHPLHPRASSPVVAYLASRESAWITGQVLRVEGNKVMRMVPWQIGESYQPKTDTWLDATDLDLALRRVYGVVPRGIG